MELSIQERLKDLRVERGLTLEQLAEETHLSKSALGSYEGDDLKDISHHALIHLAKVYEVTVDYLLGRSKTKNHPNAELADLRLSDDILDVLDEHNGDQQHADQSQQSTDANAVEGFALEVLVGQQGGIAVDDEQIGRASCRERV